MVDHHEGAPAVAFAAPIGSLLETLHARAPAKVEALAHVKRAVAHGLLSVGLKVHCLNNAELFAPLINALGGEGQVLERNVFKRSQATFCLVLPPVGSAEAAILLLECLEEYTGCRMFNNSDIQLQVCSPGRLRCRNAALHAIGFYLGSDTLRQYSLEDFATTVSANYYHRGKRLVIYDAGLIGEFDAAFAWWGRTKSGLTIRPTLPFLNGRTDIMVGPGSPSDIHNINLLATLLVHAQSYDSDGYWSSLGELFISDLIALLDRHLLTGLVEAPWICLSEFDGSPTHDQLFLSALQELTAYAAAEASRLEVSNSSGRSSQDSCAPKSILHEMQELLGTYGAIVTSIREEAHGGFQ
jgi:hypothetical protein